MATLSSLAGRSCSCLLRRVGQLNPSKFGALSTPPVANLTATHGEPLDRPKPWPYKTRSYGLCWQMIDKTTNRIDENSKIIVVDGNLATNKSDIAQQIAKEFDLLYVPSPDFDRVFYNPAAEWDMREVDEQLPRGAKAWDLKRFYTDPHPQRSRVGMMQVYHFCNRLMQYTRSVHHMLSTGQGLVMNRSVFSDYVFADTMRKFDYYTPEGLEFYYMIRDNSICEILKPHVTVYLDAPISMVRDGLKKRNIAYEVNSKVLSDEYLQSINDVYTNKLLPEMRKSGQVLTYDLKDGLEMEFLVEDLERLDLETATEEYPDRFTDWTKLREDEWAYYRRFYGADWQVHNLFSRPLPWEAPELLLQDSDLEAFQKIVLENPKMVWEPGYNPELNKNLLFKW